MKKIAIALAILVAGSPNFAAAQAKPVAAAVTPVPAPLCADAVVRLDDIQKYLSEIWAEGLGDDSAPRANMRNTDRTALYTEAGVLLAQMAQAKCAPYPKVVTHLRYIDATRACLKARANFKEGDKLEACAKKDWTPNLVQ